MNAPDDLEALLRSLTPNALPADVKELLREEPAGPRPHPLRRFRLALAGVGSLAAAAALVFLIQGPAARPIPASAPAITVLHRDSELVASRHLGLVEKEGRLFRMEERRWRDDEAALCSSTPVTVRLHADRREIVYQPVRFD